MISVGKLWPAFTIIALPVLIFGCGETGGSGALEPLADEPMILESVMCLRIDDARPVAITNSFLESDEEIYVWIYWTNIKGRSDIEAVWFRPNKDAPFYEESQVIHSSSGFGITWFFIEAPSDGFTAGEWSVDIYLDGQFERSHLFIVEG